METLKTHPLNKKTKTELINIILRKDDKEQELQTAINAYQEKENRYKIKCSEISNENDTLKQNIKQMNAYCNRLELSNNKITNKFKTMFIGLMISIVLNIALLVGCLI